MRTAPGKSRGILLDLKGIVYEHGLPDDDREYALTGDPIRKATDAAPRRCDQCWAMYYGPSCPRCGHQNVSERRSAYAQRPIDVQRVERVATDAEKMRTLATLVAKGRAKGYKPGYACAVFKSIYGYWPSQQMVNNVRV